MQRYRLFVQADHRLSCIIGALIDRQNIFHSADVAPDGRPTRGDEVRGSGRREADQRERRNYTAPDLLIGPYSIKVEQTGFKTYDRTGIVLNSNDTVRVDVTMQVGELTESVTVAADAIRVQADTSEVSDTISGRQVSQLSVNGRHIAALAMLTPGASSDLPDFNLPIGVGGSTNISFNGQRTDHNVWMIDGGENYDRGCGGCVTMMPSMDAITEFKTLTSNSSADLGLGSGGTINLIIKSGARQFHGSAWELFRNDALDANSYFANLNGSKKPELRSNVFGFNIGGPVWIPKVYNKDRNKTFFFLNQEWRKIVLGSQIFATAIPQDQRNGDFSADEASAGAGHERSGSDRQVPGARAHTRAAVPGKQDPVVIARPKRTTLLRVGRHAAAECSR